MSNFNQTANCTNYSQVVDLFKSLLFNKVFPEAWEESQFNRYSTVSYQDLTTYNTI